MNNEVEVSLIAVTVPEPVARSCWDPECEGCFGCSDLSEEEYANS